MKVFFINNAGGGFADTIEVEPATTVSKLFSQRMPGQQPTDHLIRVNRLPATSDQILHEGDRISITPVKIQGARFIPSKAAA
jgi:hypothetical protein